ncbi:MAG: putative Ig domain-containing protein [Gammaproteobacteria bacterium]
MKNRLLIGTLFLLPAVAGYADGEIYESAGIAPQFIFELDKDNVFGALFEAGSDGYYRGNLTFAAQGSEQHWFKFSGEYLLEHQDINFTYDPRQIWVDQYAAGATYQFFPMVRSPVALLANAYGSYTPSENVNSYQRIAEAIAYGGNAGLTAFFSTRTQIEATLRYDVVTFHQTFSPDTTEQGLGGSGFLKQYFGCRYNMIAGTDITSIYNNYYAAFNVLFPVGMQAVQVGVRGQYNDPHDNLTRSLVGLVTFGLQPQQSCNPAVTQTRETLASFASRPAVYMPTVLAKLDEELENSITVFIPNLTLDAIHNPLDISSYFSAFTPGPLTYTYSSALPSGISFDGTTGTFLATLPVTPATGTFTGSVTATNSNGQTVTSNVFNVFYVFF